MSAHSDRIANADDNANANAAPPRTRRGPAFSLNPIAHHGSYTQFATPPRFQFSNDDEKNKIPSSGVQARRNIFRSLNRQFEYASPFEGGRRMAAPRLSDDEIEDDPVSAPDKKQKNKPVSDRDFLEDASNVWQRSMKRPRMSLWPAHASQAVTSDLIKDDDDMNNEINDSSSPTPDSPVSPPARHKSPKSMLVTPLHADDELSAVKSIEEIPGPQTPNHISSNIDHGHSVSKTTSSIRNRPKFILSANYTPTSQDTSITSTAPFARKKPAFVIPRSPSPSQEDLSSIPTPFSPAKIRTLRRPGRPKSSVVSAGYVSDGMAEHLRDWILETDMKRTATSGQRTQGAQNIERFMLIGRIQSCHNAFLRSSGPVVMATVIPERLEKGLEQRLVDNNSEVVSLLLLGVAVSQASTNNNRQSDSRQKLKTGDIIRVGAGLSWEIEVGTSPAHKALFGDRPGDSEVVASLESGPYQSPESEANRITTSLVDSADIRPQKWLVTAEWDLVERCA